MLLNMLKRLLRSWPPPSHPRLHPIARPRLEALEDRFLPAEFSYTGYLIGDHTWGNYQDWNNQQNQPSGSVPGNGDSVTFGMSSLNMEVPSYITSLASLTVTNTYGGTVIFDSPVTITQTFTLSTFGGGSVQPYLSASQPSDTDGLTLSGANGVWTSGALTAADGGGGKVGPVRVLNGSTYTIGGGTVTNLPTDADIIVGTTGAGASSGTVTMKGSDMTYSNIDPYQITVNNGLFVMADNPNTTRGDNIKGGNPYAKITTGASGTFRVDCGTGDVVSFNSSASANLINSGTLEVRHMNSMRFTANLNNGGWAVWGTAGSSTTIGKPHISGTGTFGSATLATANDDNGKGIFVAPAPFRQTPGFMSIYGENNKVTLAAKTSQLQVQGILDLALNPADFSWLHSTLEVTVGYVQIVEPAVGFTDARFIVNFRATDKTLKTFQADTLTVDNGNFNYVQASGAWPTVEFDWASSSVNGIGGEWTLPYVFTPNGSVNGKVIVTGNNPPGATGKWSNQPNFGTELDAVWTSN